MLISIGMKISATKMTCAKTLRERIASWLESDAANLDISIDMQDLTDWIGEVIEENNLGALVLFWDEFSKFFFQQSKQPRRISEAGGTVEPLLS